MQLILQRVNAIANKTADIVEECAAPTVRREFHGAASSLSRRQRGAPFEKRASTRKAAFSPLPSPAPLRLDGAIWPIQAR